MLTIRVLKHREVEFSRTVPDDAIVKRADQWTAIPQVSSSALSSTMVHEWGSG